MGDEIKYPGSLLAPIPVADNPHIPEAVKRKQRFIESGKSKITLADVEALFAWAESKQINTFSGTPREWFFVLCEIADRESLRWICSDILRDCEFMPNVSIIYSSLQNRKTKPNGKESSAEGPAGQESAGDTGGPRSDKQSEPISGSGERDLDSESIRAGKRINGLAPRVSGDELPRRDKGSGKIPE